MDELHEPARTGEQVGFFELLIAVGGGRFGVDLVVHFDEPHFAILLGHLSVHSEQDVLQEGVSKKDKKPSVNCSVRKSWRRLEGRAEWINGWIDEWMGTVRIEEAVDGTFEWMHLRMEARWMEASEWR